MARKRKRKRKVKKRLKVELIGLLLILLAIFGSGLAGISEGAIPSIMENIFNFLLGAWYFVASLILLIIGIFLLVRRRLPNFKANKLVGLYIILSGVLLLTHILKFNPHLPSENSIIKLTWDHFISYKNGEIGLFQTGGGMIGGLLFTITYFLFSSLGSYIIAVFILVIGFILMTDYSLGELFSTLWNKIKTSYQALVKKKSINKKDKRKTQKKKQSKKDKKNTNDTRKQKRSEVMIEGLSSEEHTVDNESMVEEPVTPEPLTSEINEDDPLDTSDESDEVVIKSTNVPEVENPDYHLPPMNLLDNPPKNSQQEDKSHIQDTVDKLDETFHSFGVQAQVTKAHVGPAVTRYEIYPEAGVKVSRIVNLQDDLALALAAQDIRIEAPIPGKSAIGIEVPNTNVAMVSLKEVLDVNVKPDSKLLFALGRDISGDAILGELNKMPHLLIAGATGSGKSVCINGIITSILMRAKPHEVKMMMIDPKKVELNVYNGIPHLLTPVVTDPKKAAQALRQVVAEMERRYELFSESSSRNIEGYNEYVKKHNETAEEPLPQLPFIVVLVDELADLMMVAAKDVEDSITRLAQMARAAGIHLIIATQRPSVDVITGVIKANIPSRIAFSVSSQVDSRTILDTGGAEKLLGRGDMLYIPVGKSKPTRVQGAFLSDQEVERVVNHCINEQEVVYQEDMIPKEVTEAVDDFEDEIYDEAVKLVIEMQTASVSLLQRRFRIGYTRAGRLIDAMEDRGIVGPHEGSKPRTVLVSEATEEEDT